MVKRVFVEHLKRLSILHLVVEVPLMQSGDASDCKLELLHDKLWLSIGSSDRVLIGSISELDIVSLSIPIKISSSASSSSCSVIECRIPVRSRALSSPSKSINDTMEKPLPARVLSNLVAIKCIDCNSPLVSCQFTRVVDMPSEYWHEFVDCWVCHPGDEQYIDMTRNALSSPRISQLMCGNSSVWMHLDCLDAENVDILHEVVYCRSCRTRVGSVSDKKDRQLGVSAVLQKHKLTFQTEAGLSLQCSFSDCFIFELYDNSRAHANFQFILADGNGVPQALLWIFNWSCELMIDNHMEKAVKILYLYRDDKPEMFKKQLDNWLKIPECDHEHAHSDLQEPIAETLKLSGEELQELYRDLQARNQQLPSRLQTFVEFKQSFWPR
eukprot:Partr_v1_DN25774_c1_g1_i2_m74670 putative ubiquitin protein ligase E3D